MWCTCATNVRGIGTGTAKFQPPKDSGIDPDCLVQIQQVIFTAPPPTDVSPKNDFTVSQGRGRSRGGLKCLLSSTSERSVSFLLINAAMDHHVREARRRPERGCKSWKRGVDCVRHAEYTSLLFLQVLNIKSIYLVCTKYDVSRARKFGAVLSSTKDPSSEHSVEAQRGARRWGYSPSQRATYQHTVITRRIQV